MPGAERDARGGSGGSALAGPGALWLLASVRPSVLRRPGGGCGDGQPDLRVARSGLEPASLDERELRSGMARPGRKRFVHRAAACAHGGLHGDRDQ